MTTSEQRRALDALLGDALAKRGRAGVVLSWTVVLALALAMAVVHASDGARSFLEGIVGRGISIHLVVVALPFAFALAGGAASIDAGHAALARLRAVDETDLARAGPRAAMRLAALRAVVPTLALAVLATLLSLGDPHLAARRLLVSALLVLLGVFSATTLAALGVISSKLAGRRGRWLLLAIVLVPWIVSSFPSVPETLSLPGAYQEAKRLILTRDAT